MAYIMKGLVILSALGFVLAVIGSLTSFHFINVPPEGYSRACSNLALIAIAMAVCLKKD